MNKKKKMIILVSIFLCIVGAGIVLSQKERPEEWVKVGENDTGVLFYDKGSIKRDGKGEVTVRTKHVFSPDMCVSLASALPELKMASHYASLEKVNCRKWEYNQVEILFKDPHGRVLNNPNKAKGNARPIGYRPIPPDTFIERLAREVCVVSGAGDGKGKVIAPGGGVPGGSAKKTTRTKDWRKEALELEEKGDWVGLIAYCQVWTMAEPENDAAWSYLGYVYAASGDIPRAIVYFRKALDIDPEDTATWYDLGLAYKVKGQNRQVTEVYQRLEKLDPKLAEKFYKNVVLQGGTHGQGR